jgi:hypothetical protein
MIYVLKEWNGKASGDTSLITTDKRLAMAMRECTMTYEAALKKYGKSHFQVDDVKCSTIDSYTSNKAFREGNARKRQTWY